MCLQQTAMHISDYHIINTKSIYIYDKHLLECLIMHSQREAYIYGFGIKLRQRRTPASSESLGIYSQQSVPISHIVWTD